MKLSKFTSNNQFLRVSAEPHGGDLTSFLKKESLEVVINIHEFGPKTKTRLRDEMKSFDPNIKSKRKCLSLKISKSSFGLINRFIKLYFGHKVQCNIIELEFDREVFRLINLMFLMNICNFKCRTLVIKVPDGLNQIELDKLNQISSKLFENMVQKLENFSIEIRSSDSNYIKIEKETDINSLGGHKLIPAMSKLLDQVTDISLSNFNLKKMLMFRKLVCFCQPKNIIISLFLTTNTYLVELKKILSFFIQVRGFTGNLYIRYNYDISKRSNEYYRLIGATLLRCPQKFDNICFRPSETTNIPYIAPTEAEKIIAQMYATICYRNDWITFKLPIDLEQKSFFVYLGIISANSLIRYYL